MTFTDPALCDFFIANGRYPFIDDGRKPWTYHGWMLPMVVDIQATEYQGIVNRWGYYFETLERGRLLDSHIPRITFDGWPNPAVMKDFTSWVHIVDAYEGGWSSLLRLIDWLAFALGVGDDPKLKEKCNEELYRKVNIGPMLQYPHDYFGTFIADHRANGWNPTAFFPTPHNVVEMMTVMTMGEGDHRKSKVCDPTVGTGRMLMHASNHSLCLYGTDIDPVVIQATKINGALYAPWMTWPLPAKVLGYEVAELPPPPPAPLRIYDDPAPVEVQKKRRRVDDRQGTLFQL